MVNLDALGPFPVLQRPLTLAPRDPKPAAGPERAGPLAWWKLDDANGTTAANAAGNQFHGQIQGPPHWSPGPAAADGPVAVNNVPVTLGENGASRGRFFNGWLGDARLYDRGLSLEEVRALHRAGAK